MGSQSMKLPRQLDNRIVPILITWDVDPDRWTTLELRRGALSKAIDVCEEFGIHSTFFFTANFAHEYPEQIKRMQVLNQEIGCHGLTHTDEEDYDRMPEEMQRTYIGDATKKLRRLVSSPIQTFRSPRVKTSALTLRLLGEHGYQSDSSICSQRMDLLSSNLINIGWLVAPRHPYHPHHKAAFRRGDLPIWEIPVSALGVPWISGSLSVFGLRIMKTLFRLLLTEARLTGKPLVYLAHPTEMLLSTARRKNGGLRQFSPKSILTHGFLFRNLFFRLNGEILLQATRELFAYMASFPGVKFMSCGEYVDFISLNHSLQ
jgi:peptidoglycan/xylan/chitin deacetylase (PgdA/CDA1 family)